MDKLKIRLKATGKIDYCYEKLEQDGFIEKFGRQIPNYKHTYFKDEEAKIPMYRDDFDIIPWEPFELFGVECGEGWHELLKPIFKYVEEYNKDKAEDKRMEICQIKEKWGWLCVYLNFYTPEVNKIINTAEKEASQTCELCGSKKDVGMACEGWITTECHDCMKKWCQKNEKPHRWKRNSDGKIYWVHPDKEDELFEGTEM